MRRFLKIVGIIVVAGISFLAGVIVLYINQPRLELVLIELRNDSGKDISTVELTEAHGIIVRLPPIPAGSATKTAFYYPGETGYNLRVEFSDKEVIIGGAGYVEPGYRIVETITGTGIESDYQTLYWP